MKKFRTHYDNLQVVETASIEVIRGAYRHLAQKWHPDKNLENPGRAERNTKIINEAFAVLSDPQRRREHDDWIAAQQRAKASPRAADTDSSKMRSEGGWVAQSGSDFNATAPNQAHARQTPEFHTQGNPRLNPGRLGFFKGLGVTVIFLLSLAMCIAGLYQLFTVRFEWIKLVGFIIWGPICVFSFVALFRPSFVGEDTYQMAIKQVSFIGPFVGFLTLAIVGGFTFLALYFYVT